MEPLSPPTALFGGALIGLGATLLLSLNGRIAGISGIASGILGAKTGDVLWRCLFLVGLFAGSALQQWLSTVEVSQQQASNPLLMMLAGILVGFGTRMGNGCTSGHGVCGLGRLSIRSLIATLVYVATGIATVLIVRHVLGIAS